jgi:hypothetical protein
MGLLSAVFFWYHEESLRKKWALLHSVGYSISKFEEQARLVTGLGTQADRSSCQSQSAAQGLRKNSVVSPTYVGASETKVVPVANDDAMENGELSAVAALMEKSVRSCDPTCGTKVVPKMGWVDSSADATAEGMITQEESATDKVENFGAVIVLSPGILDTSPRIIGDPGDEDNIRSV